MTIRQLYTHQNGLTGNWGDEIHDTEEIVAGYYSEVDVGNFSYNGVGFALGGKIIEAVSGEALPYFAKRHLLDPLGMVHTQFTCSSYGARSTAQDMARLGQLFLNHGKYGEQEFFREPTYGQMLPISGQRGFGVQSRRPPGFSASSFGHSAANSTLFVIDPEHDLVVVIVSGNNHKDFASIADPLYREIANALE
jgi:CubicO group peptidase (beta-lactamase class C family)